MYPHIIVTLRAGTPHHEGAVVCSNGVTLSRNALTLGAFLTNELTRIVPLVRWTMPSKLVGSFEVRTEVALTIVSFSYICEVNS